MRQVTPIINWFSRAEAAAELRVSTRTIDRYVRQGRIAATQLVVGGAVRISASSVERLLEGTKLHPCKVGVAALARF